MGRTKIKENMPVIVDAFICVISCFSECNFKLKSDGPKHFGLSLFSLHIRSMWETTVMHKQVSGWTVNFGPNFPESPFLELKTRKPPPHFRKLQIWDDQSLLWNTPPFQKTSDLGWPKFTPEYPPNENFRFGMTKVYSGIPPPISENFRFGMTKVYSGIPPQWKLQIWDDQSLLQNTPPISENFRFGMTKVYSGIPTPISENFRFGMTKVYSGIPPISENFRFGMTKVYSGIPPPPHFGKLQIWDDQCLLWNTPPFRKTSDLGWPKFTLEYPPNENFRFGMTKVYSRIPPPHFGKLQIWDDQSLLWNTPHFGKLQIWDDQSLLWNTPPMKTSDLGWPKFTPEYPPSPILENFRFGMTKVYSAIPTPILENFRFGMTKVYSGIPPPPILENFRFEMTKVYSGIPPPFRKTSDLGWPKFTLEYPPNENFRSGMTKVYSRIPPLPHFGKLQIWDDQSLLRNTPPMKIVRESKSESFRMPRVTTCGDFIQPG